MHRLVVAMMFLTSKTFTLNLNLSITIQGRATTLKSNTIVARSALPGHLIYEVTTMPRYRRHTMHAILAHIVEHLVLSRAFLLN